MLVAYRRVQHNSAEPSLAQHPGCLPGAAGHAQTELRAPIPGKPSTSTLHTFCCLVSSTSDRSVIVTEEESCCHIVQPSGLAEHNAGVQCLPLLPECAVMAVNVLCVICHCHPIAIVICHQPRTLQSGALSVPVMYTVKAFLCQQCQT